MPRAAQEIAKRQKKKRNRLNKESGTEVNPGKCAKASKTRKKEFPLWLSRNLTSIHEHVGLILLSGLRIRRGCEMWCRSQMRLRSGIAVAVM